ncbi:MAG: hypothetical protein LBS62_08185 [Clostridiales bacterium]|nr:hypothetical protein [Clostridiales bacterium]
MYTTKKMKNCRSFRAAGQDMASPSYRRIQDSNCSECVYFSSRNCGMDVADSIEPALELFS